MANKFKAGDIVQLKSGGPAMTIYELSKQQPIFYKCTWFKGASKETGNFTEETLQNYVPPKP